MKNGNLSNNGVGTYLKFLYDIHSLKILQDHK